MSMIMVSFSSNDEELFENISEKNKMLIKQAVATDYDSLYINEIVKYRDEIIDKAYEHGRIFEILDEEESSVLGGLIRVVATKLGNKDIEDMMWKPILSEKTIFDFYFAVSTIRAGKDENLVKAVGSCGEVYEEEDIIDSACRKIMNVIEYAMKNRDKIAQIAIYDGT